MIELAGISPEVFHYTHLTSFINIVLSNKFQASPVIGTASEDPISKGYLYYFSTSRSPNNTYTKSFADFDIILKLDGRKLGNTYKAHPVDYWGPNFREPNKGLTEQEDRIILNKSEIPNAIAYMKEVRLYNNQSTKLDQPRIDKLFQVLKVLKSRKIPIYVYTDEQAFRINNKNKAITVVQLMEYLTNPINKGSSTYPKDWASRRKSGLRDYVALLKTPANKKLTLPDYAKRMVNTYLTGQVYYHNDFITLFGNDLHNFKTDQKARKDLAFILEFMRNEKVDLRGLVELLDKKWSGKELSKMRELIVETADTIPEWYKKLSRERQRDYLKEHPNSKIARTLNDKKELPGLGVKKVTKELKVEKAPAQEVLEKRGSPTKFKGPRSVADSLSGKPRVERNIVSKLDRLAALSKQAKEAGKEAPDFDLCQVSIPGTNLFCNQNKGIPRKEMPQLKGTPTPNSWADINLPKDSKGEVDAEGAFKEMLKSKKIHTVEKTVDAASLKATQSQLVGSKIAGMFQALKKEPNHPGITAPIYVSKDGYILDGHHRWAAMVGLDMADGLKESVKMPVVQVDMSIEDLVKATNDFADKIGIAQKAGKVKEAASAAKYLDSLIKPAADSVTKLRKSDVFRVLDEAPAKDRKALGEYIVHNKPELADEVRDTLEEEFSIVLNTVEDDCCGLQAARLQHRIIYTISGVKMLPKDSAETATVYGLSKEFPVYQSTIAKKLNVHPDSVNLFLVDTSGFVLWKTPGSKEVSKFDPEKIKP